GYRTSRMAHSSTVRRSWAVFRNADRPTSRHDYRPRWQESLIWRTPGQPHGVRDHTQTNLALTDQGLVSRRETMIYFRMLRNPRFRGCATGENQRPGSYPECQREEENSTLHGDDHMFATLSQ